jgi:multimeric flavodoxin WrbA
MKTLLLYYSNRQSIRELCEASAKDSQVDVMELRDRFDRGTVWCSTVGVCKAISGTGSKLDEFNVNFDEYDSIIVATPVWGFNPVPAINEFLHRTNFAGREVSGLLIHSGKTAGMAGDVLRKRIKLAGGVCRGVVSVPIKELKEKKCDVFSYAKLKFQKAV